ncbi:COG1361 S-layer family protein [Halobacteriaceae archaeon GCM10025711]
MTLASPDGNRTGRVTEFPVGDLAPGEAGAFRFRVTLPPGADPVPRAFDLVVTYRDPDGNQRRSDPLPVDATVSPQRDQFRVSPVNATVEVDADATLVVGVINNGDRPVTNVSAALSAAEPLESEDPVAYAGALDPGERTTVRFALSATDEAIPKTSLVTLNLSYEDADGDRAVSGPYSVPVEVVEPVGPGLPVLPLVAVVVVLVVGAWWWRSRR